MSFELSEMILGCGLEKGGRRAVLEAMAHFADLDTGMVRVSQVRLAQRAGLTERQVRRVLDGLLADNELQGLLRCVRGGAGRGQAAVYRLDVMRLEPLRAAMNTAARRIYAGAAKAQLDSGLSGVKATPDNIRAVFAVLARQLAEEEQFSARRAVEALRDEFEGVMARHAELCVIGRPLEDNSGPVDEGRKPGHDVRLSGDENPDKMSENPDILSSAHNKDTSPSGITSFAREAPCGKIMAGAATGYDRFLLDTEGMLAHATLNRRQRAELIEDLQGRTARVTRDGVLAIRSRSEADAEAMADRWLDALLGWAGDVGLSGVVFDVAFPAPPPGPRAPQPSQSQQSTEA